MKKTLALPLLRSISAILIGTLLAFWSQSAVLYLIRALGCLFLVPGLLSLLAYYRRSGTHRFGWSQVLGIGSIFFGVCLIVSPLFFEKSLMYALGVIIAYAGLNQIIFLTAARQWKPVPMGFYVVPVLVMLLGIFILFNPIASANLPFILLGIGCMVYGVSDLVSVLKFRRKDEIVQELQVTGE